MAEVIAGIAMIAAIISAAEGALQIFKKIKGRRKKEPTQREAEVQQADRQLDQTLQDSHTAIRSIHYQNLIGPYGRAFAQSDGINFPL